VRFEHVGFRYPRPEDVTLASLESVAKEETLVEHPDVLLDVDFEIRPGTMVALVGPSGAGKSTIASLVPRLYDPTSGTIRINGIDLREFNQQDVRDAIGVVSQEAHLFHDTIRMNLQYAAPQATDDELMAALEMAQLGDFMRGLTLGLDTVVGDRGHRLSGGEKQRMALARVLLKQPRIIVLDEATAHLDSESEVAVQTALAQALVGRTALVIAHRLSTIRDADEIVVVEQGSVVERGTHQALLERSGLYATLYATQFSSTP
jgi:ATP-binding cassette subfamily B protein